MTCHNRREKTDKCLESLFRILPDCEVYVTDDGSKDGTAAMVHEKYPHAIVIPGDGNLFWSRGMYVAWKEAIKQDYDFYLWLNDDIELYPFFFKELMDCCNYGGGTCIITGLIEDFDHTRILYGGTNAQKQLLEGNGQPQEVTNMNGNVLLIPRAVVRQIGIMDPRLHHDLGDVDYGLTAREQGIKVYTTRRAVAAGYENNFCRVRKWGVNIIQRMKRLHSPLGSPPAINFYFRRKHYGILNATAYYIYIYLLNILPDNIVEIIWGETYKNK